MTSLSVDTVRYASRSIELLLAEVLSPDLYNACVQGPRGFDRLSIFPKCTLLIPFPRGRHKSVIVNSLLLSRHQIR